MNAYWRAANYLSVGRIYLYDNSLLKRPLKLLDVKPLVVGHWGHHPWPELWQRWGQPEIWRLPHGHISGLFVPGLTGRVFDWLAPRLEKTTPSAPS
jgi:hypothetical protein